MSFAYPFSALVAQDDLKLCLMLIAVQPRIGGVLIRGDKGAAKSTAARGIADLLLPLNDKALEDKDAPFVNLPLGSSEERVIGALDLEHALRGERKLQTGLLGQADGGVLYIDEVNLLVDPLVDVLLDAAASGVNRVERDGLSIEQASRFALIGSMNPEEGTLRPQFLDRFGLCVDIVAPREPALRAEIVRRRLRFEHDPKGFVAQYVDEQKKLKALLYRARTHLPNITVPDDVLTAIAERCQAAHVSSLRADLVLTRSAAAYAALQGADEVTGEHAERVAPFVLAHRQAGHASNPPTHHRKGSPQSDEQKTPPSQSPGLSQSHAESETTGSKEVDSQVDEPTHDTQSPDQPQRPRRAAQPDQTFSIGAASVIPIDLVSPRGSKQAANTSQSHLTRSVKTATPQHLAVSDSVRHALVRTALGGEAFSTLTTDDLHGYQKGDSERERVLFVVDSSGSLAERKRMANVKGVVAKMLEEVYEQRCEVSLIAFRGARAQCVVPWTRDVARTIAALEALPTGGRTPLAHALELVGVATDTRVSLALFTDGKSNIPLQEGNDAWQDALEGARRLRNLRATVVDTEESLVRLGRARELAEAMEATYISLIAHTDFD